MENENENVITLSEYFENGIHRIFTLLNNKEPLNVIIEANSRGYHFYGHNEITLDYVYMSCPPETKIKLLSMEYTRCIFDHYEEGTNKDFEDTVTVRTQAGREIEIMAGEDMRRNGDFDRLREKIKKLIEMDGEFSAEIEECPELGLVTITDPTPVNYIKLDKPKIV